MKKSELDFELPEELIARYPRERRDDSRLLVHHSTQDRSVHTSFSRLPEYLREDDLLVLNDTRVLPARLVLHKESGGRVEGLWLAAGEQPEEARLMLSGGRLRPGVRLVDAEQRAVVELVDKPEPGRWIARSLVGSWQSLLAKIGTPPLPPYIRRLRAAAGEDEIQEADYERYQTIWAAAAGSVAAEGRGGVVGDGAGGARSRPVSSIRARGGGGTTGTTTTTIGSTPTPTPTPTTWGRPPRRAPTPRETRRRGRRPRPREPRRRRPRPPASPQTRPDPPRPPRRR